MASSSRIETPSAPALQRRLTAWPRPRRFLLACSGGPDSQLLLYLLADLGLAAVRVVHVDHGLHPHSARWAEFCRRHCQELGLEFVLRRLEAPCPPGLSVESWARQQRYARFAELMDPGDMLLTAHHADDQAETVLAHLLRGSGPRGLSAMAALRPFAGGWHGRPLLDFGRDQIRAAVRARGIGFLEDPGNAERRFDRNYLRHEVLPGLRQRWPGLSASLARAARHQGALAALLDEVAAGDLAQLVLADRSVLDVDRLQTLSPVRQANVLRHWLAGQSLPPPRAVHIEQILGGLVHSRRAAGPCVRWPGAELRRYRRCLYALRPLPPHDPGRCLDWDPARPVDLPLGRLCLTPPGGPSGGPSGDNETGADAEILVMREVERRHWQLRFRRGGERIRLAGGRHHRRLKNLFQERGILPWYRDRIPLLYIGERLCAAPGIGISAEMAALAGEPAWQLRWQHPGLLRAL